MALQGLLKVGLRVYGLGFGFGVLVLGGVFVG